MHDTDMPVKRPSMRTKPSAIERSSARRRTWVRTARTVVLGTLAAIAAMFWVARQYGVQTEVMLEFLVTSVFFVGLMIGSGLIGVLLLRGLRQLFKRR